MHTCGRTPFPVNVNVVSTHKMRWKVGENWLWQSPDIPKFLYMSIIIRIACGSKARDWVVRRRAECKVGQRGTTTHRRPPKSTQSVAEVKELRSSRWKKWEQSWEMCVPVSKSFGKCGQMLVQSWKMRKK